MFNKMADMSKMMKQAQEMQTKISEIQGQIENITVNGVAGGGVVSVILNGKDIIKGIKIDPSLIIPEEVEILEDLIIAAYSDAKQKSEVLIAKKTKEIMGDMKLPEGMNLGI